MDTIKEWTKAQIEHYDRQVASRMKFISSTKEVKKTILKRLNLCMNYGSFSQNKNKINDTDTVKLAFLIGDECEIQLYNKNAELSQSFIVDKAFHTDFEAYLKGLKKLNEPKKEKEDRESKKKEFMELESTFDNVRLALEDYLSDELAAELSKVSARIYDYMNEQ